MAPTQGVHSVPPPELLERILNILQSTQDASRSLSSCALASRQLLPIVRSLRFSTVQVLTNRDVDQVPQFAELLVNNVGLSSHIRSFSFTGHHDSRRKPQFPDPWTTVDPGKDLSTILSSIPNVVSLQISSPFIKMTSWLTMSDAIQTAISNLVHQSSLRSVVLSGLMNLPVSLLNSVSFSSLSLRNCSFGTDFDEQKARASDIEALHLWSATTGRNYLEMEIDFILHQFTPVRISGLKHLWLRVRKLAYHPRIMDLLSHCRESLEVLGLDVAISFTVESFNGFSLSNLPRLRRFHLKMSFLIDSGPLGTPPARISSLANFISTIYTPMPPQSFELLYIELIVNALDSEEPPESLEPETWSELDKVLATVIGNMPDSGQVEIMLKENVNSQAIPLEQMACFPRCSETGRLKLLPSGGERWFDK